MITVINNKTNLLLSNILLVSVSLFISKPANAFYQWQNEQTQGEARGFINAYASVFDYPRNNILYPNQTPTGVAAIARLMFDATKGEHLSLEFNAYQTYIPTELKGNSALLTSTERSAILDKSFNTKNYVHLAIDRLALRWSDENLNITVGRQAINLATTFYFTPNDFFAPFSAQTFFRVYKPGVDALRVQYGLSELSQLSLISVAGYKADNKSKTGWSNTPDGTRASHLIRWFGVFNEIETTLILGDVRDKNIFGGAIQGELFDWLGVRIEGHHAVLQQNSNSDYTQISFGFEHQWQNNTELRLEIFHNELGSNTISQYPKILNTTNLQYLARHYSALGGSYQFTPLLIGQAVVISNLVDQSNLISLYATYSLSDESELAINLSLPTGKTPVGIKLKSEFGSYPKYLNIEFRSYF